MGRLKHLSHARIVVSRVPGAHHRGKLLAGPLRITCALGSHGVVCNKREGDGASPAGRFRLTGVLYRGERTPRPRTLLALRRLRRKDGWCDDSASAHYNRRIDLPVRASHEQLWRSDHLYDVIIIVDYNDRPRVKGRGSAIFLHIARPDLAPTAGCVAFSLADMRRLLPRLSPRTAIVIS